MSEEKLLKNIRFRTVRPTDIPACAEIEEASYPPDEAASKSALQYRQHHAAPYFRCAVIPNEKDDDNDTIIGYICSTRCREFSHESMSTHVPNGQLLAIHSVVVKEEYRRQGIAAAMLKGYVERVEEKNDGGIEKMVLLAKKELLTFYVDCGFSVVRPSAIEHGADQWYDLELVLDTTGLKGGSLYYIVDAFADPETPGTGNPAAIVVLDNRVDLNDDLHHKWMQLVAKEFNLSETAFLLPVMDEPEEPTEQKEAELHYHIRYYTPKVEVPLCGHATLASAAILYQTVQPKNKTEPTVVFQARQDVLKASLASSNPRSSRITVEFPAMPAIEVVSAEDQLAIRSMLSAAFSIAATSVLFLGLSEIGDLLVEVTHESFQNVGYDGIAYNSLLDWAGYSRGVIICCVTPQTEEKEGQDAEDCAAVVSIDFLSRFFAPKAGINEDPVTGSAHCVLAPYFVHKLGKEKVVGKQDSERGGIVECVVENDCVKLTGTAVTVMRGTLLLQPPERTSS